jgi:hypothetical protein
MHCLDTIRHRYHFVARAKKKRLLRFDQPLDASKSCDHPVVWGSAKFDLNRNVLASPDKNEIDFHMIVVAKVKELAR